MGANVILSSRDTDKLLETEKECQRTSISGGKLLIIPLDLEKYQDLSEYKVKLSKDLAMNGLDGIDVLIHSAGVSSRGYALDTTVESLTKLMV